MSEKVAVFADNGLYLTNLGRLSIGYNIVDIDVANEWMKITDKVRLATAQEVANAYGV